MTRKQTIVYLIFTILLLYIISPYVFTKNFFFNEILALFGFGTLAYKRFRVGKDPISICVLYLLIWSSLHVITSLFRMDTFYYYLRNLVIVYSMLAFFLGYYSLPYLSPYIKKIRSFLRLYIGIFVWIRLPRTLFERFGMAVLFPALFRRADSKWMPSVLLMLTLIYGVVYDSFTAIMITAFYFLLFMSPGYRFFKQSLTAVFIAFFLFFIYFQPNLALIANRYNPFNEVGIYDVINSHPLLAIDGNSTWRLVLWKEVLVDNFPGNIIGLGFGTPVMKYFPVEDYDKLATLPYVLGAHNSYIYLFGRLGIVYVILAAYIYITVFKEYFYYHSYYVKNNQALIFLSFFAISIIAFFNVALETPIYASGYWILLGFTARCIHERRKSIGQS